MTHQVNGRLFTDVVNVSLVGCGGNGSQMLGGLARLHTAMLALGHPGGLYVTVMDPDVVTEANVGRQLFSRSDIGANKAQVLTSRINAFYGLNWRAMPTEVSYSLANAESIIIGCVDNVAARVQMQQIIKGSRNLYWLDLGNDTKTGQVVLGESNRFFQNASIEDVKEGRTKVDPNGTIENPRLPTVVDLFPQMEHGKIRENNTPSCSLADALGKQDLFINQAVSTAALNLLWQMFRLGRIESHGAFINLETGYTTPLPICLNTWERMGYRPFHKHPLRKIRRTIRKPAMMRPGRFVLECGHTMNGSGEHRVRCKLC